MQISKGNVTSGFKIAANLLKSVIMMFIYFYPIGTVEVVHFGFQLSFSFSFCQPSFQNKVNTGSIQEFNPIHVHPDILLFLYTPLKRPTKEELHRTTNVF